MKKTQVFRLIQECSDTKCEELDLTDLGINEIPNEVFDLKHLKSLRLTKNNLKSVPSRIGNLTELKFLGLNYNSIEYLPREIEKLTKLTSLDLWNNNLKSLPIELGKLKNLQHLHLGFNSLNTIPKELFYPFSQLKGLDIQSNPFNDLPILQKMELVDLMTFFRSENSFFGIMEMPKELRTAFQQYLNFFSEFVEKSTGYDVPFEVTKVANGLKIKTNETANLKIDKIKLLLNKYIDFLREDLAGIKGSVEQELMKLRIEDQKSHFERQIKHLEFENKYLKENFDKVLTSHLDLSSKALLQPNTGYNPHSLIKAIRQELENFPESNRAKIENEISEIEDILSENPEETTEVKSKFQVVKDLIIGASGSSISTGLIELIKFFI